MSFLGLNYFKWLFLLHIFIFSVILFYVGFARKNTANWFYNFLGILAIIIIVYHIYRIYTHGLKTVFWNYFHVLIVAPLFLYVAYKKTNTPKVYYDIFIGLGASALVLNAYYLYSH